MANELPFSLSIAPFPEGFQGDMDETFQQAYANTTATVEGNFLTGLVLPPGSTLPTSDVGPIAMGEAWYFWDTTTNQYLPQASTTKGVKNYVKNSSYWVAQNGTNFSGIGTGSAPGSPVTTPLLDLSQFTCTHQTVVTVAQVAGPPFTPDNDLTTYATQYSNGPTLWPTLAAADLFVHEHLVEGIDIAVIQGQVLSLSFSVFTTLAGTYSVYLASNGKDACYVANFTVPASTWTRVKIPGIPPFPSTGTWSYAEGHTGLYIGIVLATGSQWQTTNLNQWISGYFVGSAQNTNFLASGSFQFTISAIKLEPAASCTYYQCPGFVQEYDDCIRYFYTTFVYQSLTAGVAILGTAYTTNSVIFSYTFPRRMCKAPTVIPWNTGGTLAAGNVTNLSSGANTAVASLTAYQKGVYSGTAPVATAGQVFAAYIQANARLS